MNLPKPSADPTIEDSREQLSALADGEAAALQRGCAVWRDDAQARASWHAYHLIGDVLRSDDLASTAARDAAFLAALRGRLAREPVVLAPPAPPAPPLRRRQAWLLPGAAAAGFVAVAGVVVVLRSGGAAPEAPLAAAQPVASAVEAAPVLPVVMIRDARLERLLAMHRGAAGGGVVAVPGAAPRSFESLAPITPVVAPVSR
jgi:sigma-E factor negative regulatory protein RseA